MGQLRDETVASPELGSILHEMTVAERHAVATLEQDFRVEGLRALGISAEETEDGMIIEGRGSDLRVGSGTIDTHKDHRIAMTFAVLALAGDERTAVELLDADCINISYPTFYDDLKDLL